MTFPLPEAQRLRAQASVEGLWAAHLANRDEKHELRHGTVQRWLDEKPHVKII